MLFGIKDLSLATPSQDPAGIPAVAALSGERVVEGAVMANSTLPDPKPVMLQIPTEVKTKKVMRFAVTTYTSRVGETDSTPFETAMGTYTRPGVAASNVLPFGTKFKIPAIFGEQVFTIEDRMNSRYNGKKIVDIWLADYDKADAFGKQYANVEILN